MGDVSLADVTHKNSSQLLHDTEDALISYFSKQTLHSLCKKKLILHYKYIILTAVRLFTASICSYITALKAVFQAEHENIKLGSQILILVCKFTSFYVFVYLFLLFMSCFSVLILLVYMLISKRCDSFLSIDESPNL